MTQEEELLVNFVTNNLDEHVNIIDNRPKNITNTDYSDLRICGYAIMTEKRSIIVGLPHSGGWSHLSPYDVILKECVSYGYINAQYIFINTITLS